MPNNFSQIISALERSISLKYGQKCEIFGFFITKISSFTFHVFSSRWYNHEANFADAIRTWSNFAGGYYFWEKIFHLVFIEGREKNQKLFLLFFGWELTFNDSISYCLTLKWIKCSVTFSFCSIWKYWVASLNVHLNFNSCKALNWNTQLNINLHCRFASAIRCLYCS